MTAKSEETSTIAPVDDATLQLHYNRKKKQYRTNQIRSVLVPARAFAVLGSFYLWLFLSGYFLTFVPKPVDVIWTLLVLLASLGVAILIFYGPWYILDKLVPSFYLISAEDKGFLSLHPAYLELSEYWKSDDADRQNDAVKSLRKAGRVIAQSWVPGETTIAKKTLDSFLAPIREMAPTRLPATAGSDKKDDVESALSVLKQLLYYCYDPKDTASLAKLKTELGALTGTEVSSPGVRERSLFRFIFPILPAAMLVSIVEVIGQSPGYDRTIILSISVIGAVSLYGILVQALGKRS